MSPVSNKIALFIDGANLYATAKTLGFDIDYKRLLKEFQSRGTLVRAFYYTAIIEDQEYSSIRPLIDWLDYHRYTQGDQGIHQRQRPPQGQGQHGYRTRGRCDGARRACRPDRAVFRRRRLPLAGRSGAAPRRPGYRGLDDFEPAADDRRRITAPSRRLHRSGGTAIQAWPRPFRASGPARAASSRAAIPAARDHHGAERR